MVKRSLVPLAAAALLWSVLPAVSQAPALGQGPGANFTLPDGSGKEIVQVQCVRCHQLTNLANSGGFNRAGWEELISSMVELPKDQTSLVTEYLAKNFPETPKPAAVLIAGPANVSIKEWVVPTLGSRPHDPLAAADGSIWWTGMFADVLGRLDPKTGEMKEYSLKRQSGPHGLVADKDGNVWYTGNRAGLVGKLDPKTGGVTEYPMPDPAARDPHTPIFDKNGTLWFTLQGSNMVGRLNPQTGDIKLVTSPTPRSNPYGMVVNSKNVVFFVEFGTNKIASIDSNTMAIKEYPLPNPETRPRRVAITSDDVLWYSDYSRGYLGRFDSKTGEAKEWPSPSGPQSRPYGIAAANDVIWYSESATRPNTLVRFDPKTEKFQTWAIPSGGGVVRNMMATRDGNLAMACSGRNRVAFVQIQPSNQSAAR